MRLSGASRRGTAGTLILIALSVGALVGVFLAVGTEAPPRVAAVDSRCVFLDDQDATPFNSLGPAPAPNWNGTFSSGPVQWYTADSVSDPEMIAAIQAAVETWEAAIPGAIVDFVYLGQTSVAATAGSSTAEQGPPDGLNVIGSDDGLLADGSPSGQNIELGRGRFKGSDSALEFDLEINFDAGQGRGLQGVQVGPGIDGFDLESVVLHELGHVLGLGHLDDTPGQAMAAILSPGSRIRTLQDLDRDCFGAIYDCSLADEICALPPTPTPVFVGATSSND